MGMRVLVNQLLELTLRGWVVRQRCMFWKILTDTHTHTHTRTVHIHIYKYTHSIYGQELSPLLRFTRCLWAWQLCAVAIGLKLACIQIYTPWSQHDPEMQGNANLLRSPSMNGRHGWRLLGSGGNASARILRDCCLAWALCDCDVIFGNNELTWIDKCRSSLMRCMKIGFGIRFFSCFFFCLLHFGVWTAFNLNLEQYLQLLVFPQDGNRHVGALRRLTVEKPLKTTRPSLLSWSCDLRTLSITRLMDVSSCTSSCEYSWL